MRTEVPTRQTLKRGIQLYGSRMGEAVVARMDSDRAMATRLGERRARLRQREAEARQLQLYCRRKMSEREDEGCNGQP